MNTDKTSTKPSKKKIKEMSETQSVGKLFPGYSSVTDFTQDGFKTLMESIRHSNSIPTRRDYSFYNTQESFKKIMSTEGNHILSLINNILKHNGIKNNIKTSILDHKTELLIEANDAILEKVADNIDEMNGIKKHNIEQTEAIHHDLAVSGSWNKSNYKKFSNASSRDISSPNETSISSVRLIAPKNIPRPQKSFKDKIDNNNGPWEPKIREKPNSRKPLAIFLEETNRGEEFSHPYEFELENFIPSNEQLLADLKDVYPKTLNETEFVEVNTEPHLENLVKELRNHTIIAVDVEHHSYRSFMGITCLMQISTVEKDYIIDTLALRDKLHVLNEIFTKPSILKIFHGADSDILWLQRDLSIYVVNMFDTHQAAKILEYSSLSLASLLERYCKFSPNKHFQLADWRMRPLPDVLKEYAREDTHYLIYIYMLLKRELLKKVHGSDRLLRTVYDRSTDICKRRYFKPRWTENSHLDFYKVCKRMFDNRQMHALKELYKWRDQVARDEDESLSYVLPNHMLLQIAETLPREMQGILACCNPIPPLLRSNLLELHQIILKARDKPVEQPILLEDTRARGSIIQLQKLNVDSALHCPHDLSKNGEFRDNLPTLLSEPRINSETILESTTDYQIENTESVFSIFKTKSGELMNKSIKTKKFLAPFERYRLVRPFIQEEERKIALEMEKKKQDKAPTQIDVDVKPQVSEITRLSTPEVVSIEDDIEKINNNLNNLIEENKTEEERIALIREHFNLLSNKTKEDEEFAKRKEEELYQKAAVIANEQVKSLIEMGGTKKRKREREDSDSEVQSANIKHQILNPAPYQVSDKYVQLGQKRKINQEHNDNENTRTPLNQIWKRKKAKNKANNANKNKNASYNQSQKNNSVNIHQLAVKMEEPDNSEASSSKKHNPNRGNKSFHKQMGKKMKYTQQNVEAFDYASVDFRQFQGGAGSANQVKNIKSKFKNKRKGNMNKSFNKSIVFNNALKKK